MAGLVADQNRDVTLDGDVIELLSNNDSSCR